MDENYPTPPRYNPAPSPAVSDLTLAFGVSAARFLRIAPPNMIDFAYIMLDAHSFKWVTTETHGVASTFARLAPHSADVRVCLEQTLEEWRLTDVEFMTRWLDIKRARYREIAARYDSRIADCYGVREGSAVIFAGASLAIESDIVRWRPVFLVRSLDVLARA